MSYRIYLSPPHLFSDVAERMTRALDSGLVAPLGPEVDAFEQAFAEVVGTTLVVALSSGTAGLLLALVDLGVGRGDDVAVSTFTFAASVNPIVYQGESPVFVDCEPT